MNILEHPDLGGRAFVDALAILGGTFGDWPSWAQLGANMSQHGPTWGDIGANRGQLGPTWSNMGQLGVIWGLTWGQLGTNLGQHGPTWSQLGANLGPTWG